MLDWTCSLLEYCLFHILYLETDLRASLQNFYGQGRFCMGFSAQTNGWSSHLRWSVFLFYRFLLRDADMHSAYLLSKDGWLAVCHTPVLCQNG